jgi:predicted nucleic acid-binding protein
MIYFDATFLVRLYVEEPGYAEVRAVPQPNAVVVSSIFGKMETEAAFHRKFREGSLDRARLQEVNAQLAHEEKYGMLEWHPLTTRIIEDVRSAFLKLPPNVFLRAGDAIHLATAAEAGFKEIYSNDKHLLAAAPIFKLKGTNPLAT